MAEAFFNRLSRHQASSAGIRVGDQAGQTLADRSREPAASDTPGNMLRIMQEEEGLDLTGNRRTQLTPEMVEQADRVFVIAPDEPYPDYLQNPASDGEVGDKVTFWEIPDLFGAPYDSVRQLKEQIKEQVRRLVAETG